MMSLQQCPQRFEVLDEHARSLPGPLPLFLPRARPQAPPLAAHLLVCLSQTSAGRGRTLQGPTNATIGAGRTTPTQDHSAAGPPPPAPGRVRRSIARNSRSSAQRGLRDRRVPVVPARSGLPTPMAACSPYCLSHHYVASAQTVVCPTACQSACPSALWMRKGASRSLAYGPSREPCARLAPTPCALGYRGAPTSPDSPSVPIDQGYRGAPTAPGCRAAAVGADGLRRWSSARPSRGSSAATAADPHAPHMAPVEARTGCVCAPRASN
jgi:hypothetical protein